MHLHFVNPCKNFHNPETPLLSSLQLKISLLSLKLRPRHRQAGELYCKAALQLQVRDFVGWWPFACSQADQVTLQAAGLHIEASQMLELATTCFKSDQLHVR